LYFFTLEFSIFFEGNRIEVRAGSPQIFFEEVDLELEAEVLFLDFVDAL
jgi:hypothetical protein